MSQQTLNNIESEKAILCGIAHYGLDALSDVDSLLEEQTFSDDTYKVVFKCFQHAINTKGNPELTSLLSSAKQLGLNELLDKNLNKVKELYTTNIKLDSVRPHASIIRRLQFGREIQNILREIYKEVSKIDGTETINTILNIPESHIQNLALSYMREDKSKPQLIGCGIDEFFQNLKDNPNKSPGLSSGYPEYDKAIGGGFRRGCVDLIGARSKSGKSLLGENITLNITQRNIPVLFLDTEMGSEDHWFRLLANMSEVDISTLNNASFNKFEESKIQQSVNTVKSLPYYYINVSGKPFEEILSIARRWLLKEVGYTNGRTNDCLIIYDYFKLMNAADVGNMAEFQALGFQITQLHNFCVEYDCPCLSFVQLNRDGLTKEGEDAVSGSDRLIWLCTSFSIFKIKNQEEILQDGIKAGNRKLIPVVSRHGPGLENGYICMQMDGKYMRVRELGTLKEIQKNRNGFPEKESNEQHQGNTDSS